MPGLLIDKKVLVQHKLDKLLNIIESITDDDNIGIVFLIPEKQYNFLHNSKIGGDEKIIYIRSDTFIKSIYGSYFIVYNEGKKICEIRNHINDPDHLNDVLNSLIKYLPEDIIIWIGVIPIEKSDIYINAGFDNPHISDKSPLSHKFVLSGVAFSKFNNSSKKIDEMTVRNKLHYASQQPGSICNIYAKFTPQAIKYLKYINNPKGKNQKELSGALTVSKVVKNGNKMIFELSPDPKSVEIGDEENVDAVWSRYNFHTHPKKAYENQGVVRGWPSSQDFVGFLLLDNETIFHTVVTLEGIYVISLSPDWKGKLKDINKKYILKHYDINHKRLITFEKYIEEINSKKYKGSQLFVVKYLSWEKTGDIFPIYFAKTKDKCIVTEETFKMYKK